MCSVLCCVVLCVLFCCVLLCFVVFSSCREKVPIRKYPNGTQDKIVGKVRASEFPRGAEVIITLAFWLGSGAEGGWGGGSLFLA